MGFVIGPVAPENNPPIEPQYYLPNRFNISQIATGQKTTVTTTVDHNYVTGQLVRLTIPSICRAEALNEQSGLVTAIPAANQVVVDIFSLYVTPFVPAPSTGTQPEIMAIGDVNSGPTNFGRTNNTTFIPGSFINISPA